MLVAARQRKTSRNDKIGCICSVAPAPLVRHFQQQRTHSLVNPLSTSARPDSVIPAGMAGESGADAGAGTYTTDEALSRLGFGRFQALLFVFFGMGWVAEAMEIMLLSFIGPPVKEEWGISGGEEGLVTSALFAGALAGACLGGLASDRYGRRIGFLFTALVTGIPGFLSAFSPNYATLLALRFVTGLGLGSSHVLPTWFLEFVPAAHRGTSMAVFTCCWTLGTIFEALLAWATMPILGWRWLLALSSSPYFILLIFFGSVPESPRYLCSRGKTVDAMLVLERIARMNNRVLPPGILTSDPKMRVDNNLDATLLLMPEDSLVIDDDRSSKSSGINSLRAIWSPDLIRSTSLLWLFNFGTYFAYYGMVLLTSELSNDKRRCASVEAHFNFMQPKDPSLYINVLVTSLAEFPGLFLAGLLGDRVGRKVSMGGMIFLCCAFLAPLAMNLREGLAITLIFCARTCIMGSFAILHAYSAEIYPTSCRNTGVGAANCLGRIASIVAPIVTVTLVENCRQKEAVFFMDLALFVAGVACALFPLETKGREIQ